MKEDIISSFDKNEVIFGEIWIDDEIVASASVEVFYNVISPSAMRARVLHLIPKEGKNFHLFQVVMEENMQIRYADTRRRLIAKLRGASALGTSTHSEFNAEIQELESLWIYPVVEDDSNDEMRSYVYSMPVCDIIRRINRGTWDSHRGFYYGLPDTFDRTPTSTINWYDDRIYFNIAEFSATLHCAIIGTDRNDKVGYPSFGIVQFGELILDPPGTMLQDDALDTLARSVTDVVMRAISILERNRMHWHTEERYINKQGDKKQPVSKRSFYKWVPPFEEREHRVISRNEIKQYREFLPVLASALYEMSPAEAVVLCQITNSYIIASVAKTIEAECIYLHSCLDLILKVRGFPKGPFSKRFIECCDALGVEFGDVLPTPTRHEIMDKRNPQSFRFTQIRNRYIHDGLIVDDYDEAIECNRIMVAMIERMMLAIVGLDYRKSPLGQKRLL